MNKLRFALIDKAFGATAPMVKKVLFHVAKKHGATVEAVIQAGLGRNTTTSEGARAAAEVKATSPTFFAPLADVWPHACPDCRAEDLPALVRCPECRTRETCEACLGRYGCPTCTAAMEARIAQRKADTAATEQNVRWLKRQLAEPLPKPPEPDGPPPPPAPEPVITPPDLTWPEGPEPGLEPVRVDPEKRLRYRATEEPDAGLSATASDAVE